MERGGDAFGELIPIEIDARIATPEDWLWRVTWHEGSGYGVSYQAKGGSSRTYLLKTSDGIRYQLVRALDLPGKPNEATVRFGEDNEMRVVVRNEGPRPIGHYGIARPPYTDFKWREIDLRLGGPELARTPDGSWVLATRRYGEVPKTVFGVLNDDGHFDLRHEAPSGGDTSYPGLVVHGKHLWASFYSSHEGKASIYLARMPLGGFQ